MQRTRTGRSLWAAGLAMLVMGSAQRALAVDDLGLVASPASTDVAPGDTVTVTLEVANLSSPINGVQALITYNPAVLALSGIAPTSLGLTPPASGWVEIAESVAAGNLDYAVTVLGGSSSANHVVATLTFNVIAEGTTRVRFRADAPPFATKLTRASDNTTIFPTKTDSADIVSACSDGLFCNGLETFNGSVCVAGAPPCVDAVACTVDACNESTDSCTHTPNNAVCDNGLFCDGAETCHVTLGCQAGTPPCNDGIACTVDTCTEATDTCVYTPNNGLCSDGLFCNGSETCSATLGCQAGTAPCVDAVTCTVDTCNEATDTCAFTPNDGLCSDGLFCTGTETCHPTLGCQPGTNPCVDAVTCTVDTCNEVTDTCAFTPDNALCDDALFCNGAETCHVTLGCQAGTFPCGDAQPCTDDTCIEATDTCIHTENDANCDNGLFCDGSETCDALLGCQPGSNPCIDGVACTVDSCDEGLNVCVYTPNHAACSNGLFCDGAEVCDPLLGCVPGSDPCAPLLCNETTDTCFAPIHIAAIEVFHNGKFGNQANPNRRVLAAGGSANSSNIVVYTHGITGVRVRFNDIVNFATTPAAAISYAWTTGTGTTFGPVTDPATNCIATAAVQSGATVLTIAVTDGYIERRWLRVTLDAAQVTKNGVALDGELVGNPAATPSGNGSPGGSAVFYLGNVTGDVDSDRKTTLTDVGLVRTNVNPFVTVSITNSFDLDKDGRVLLTDVGLTRADVNPFFTLPLISP